MTERMIGSFYGHSVTPVTVEQHSMVVGRGRVGVELELESVHNIREFRSEHWTVKDDGSLRNNGAEFVFNGPQGGVDLFQAIVDIDTFLHRNQPDASWRCSTHVHVDVRRMTVEQLKLLILGYIVTEKFMFQLSGIQRYKNNFCSSIGFSQSMVETLSSIWNLQGSDFVNLLINNWDKYSAMNFLPISRFGSVEFRLSEAKWHKSKLLKLCNRYLSLKELAEGWSGSQEEFIEFLTKEDPHGIFDKGLPKDLYAGWQEDLSLGAKLAHDVMVLAKLPVAGGPAARPMGEGALDLTRNPDDQRNFLCSFGSYNTLASNYVRATGRNLMNNISMEGDRVYLPFSAAREMLGHMPDAEGWLRGRRRTDLHNYRVWVSMEEAVEQAEAAIAPSAPPSPFDSGWTAPTVRTTATGRATPVPRSTGRAAGSTRLSDIATAARTFSFDMESGRVNDSWARIREIEPVAVDPSEGEDEDI